MDTAPSGPGSRGRGTRPPAALNLVPYIDLLTCMISFLLITAVWTQLAGLEVRRSGTGNEGEPARPTTRVVVLVDESGFNLVVDRERRPLTKLDGRYDFQRLGAELRKVKSALPDKDAVEVASADGVIFETLVQTMDTVLGAGFPGVSLLDSGAAGL